jgi:hypothetical protein
MTPHEFEDKIQRLHGPLARFDEAMVVMKRKPRSSIKDFNKRVNRAATAIVTIIFGTGIYAFAIGPIGIGGLLLMFLLTVLATGTLLMAPARRSKPIKITTKLSDSRLVEQVIAYLSHHRCNLPVQSREIVDSISSKLPLLKKGLAENGEEAQETRRLIGSHLPDLIDRYERIPAAYRDEKDGGLSVNERLFIGLSAADAAVCDLARKMNRDHLAAFQTQGRFLETRYGTDTIN